DMLRAARRHPEALDALDAELDLARGLNADFDAHRSRLRNALSDTDNLSTRARRLGEDIALALAAALLLRGENAEVGAAFCRARLGAQSARALGTLDADMDFSRLIERAFADSTG